MPVHILLWLGLYSAFPGFTLAKIYPTQFDGTTWDDDNWRLHTTALNQGHYESRMSLSNGYLGINVAALGPFFEMDAPVDGDVINGWPLFDRRQTFATIAGFYDVTPTTDGFANGTNFPWLAQYGWDSVISGIPHWAGLHISSGDEVLAASTSSSQISKFRSTLDIQNGMFMWNYTWTPSGGVAIDVEYSMLVHKLYINQAAVQLKMTASKDANVSVIDVLDGNCAVRSTSVNKGYEPRLPIIWSAVRPDNIANITAYVYSALVGDEYCDWRSRSEYNSPSLIGGNSSSIAQAMKVSLKAGETSTITKFIGGASSDAYSDPQNTALEGCWNAAHSGWDNMVASHSNEWHSIMRKDSVDSFHYPQNGSLPDDANVVQLQILAVTNPYYLLQNTVSGNAFAAAGNNTKLDSNSIPVAGLGSDSYAGQIFWDAEVWMAPGLVVAFPDAAKQIARYRIERFPMAQANVKTAYQSSQNETGKFSPNGAVFPWTSARYGNCTITGPCFDYEYHINGDIGLEVYNYYTVTGDADFFKSELFPIYDAVAQFYADLVTYNKTAQMYYLYNATDPDEYANFQTNVGYTMVLMKTHIDTANALRSRLGMEENNTWTEIASKIEIPIDHSANIILEYQTMNNTVSVKQADVVLVDNFLDYPNPYSLNDLDYYAGKQSPNGPGMTYAVFSMVANEVSPSGCSSYTYDLYGAEPYLRGPWFQFSEQLIDNFQENGGTHPAFPFLTGMGGSNQVAIFGYLGLHLVLDTLNVNPSLPPQIPSIDYRTFYWQGWPINATSNQTHTTLTRLSTPLPGANMTFMNSPIPVTIGINGSMVTSGESVMHLESSGTLTIANREIGRKKTVPGNIAQCQRIASSTGDYVKGQFPLAAIDGAVSTKWQPSQLNVSSSITVELPGPHVPIAAIEFNWAQNPPSSYSVTFSNSSSNSNFVMVTSSDHVAISNKYDPAKAAVITDYQSNSTNITLSSPVYSGNFVTLTISGNQGLVGTPDEHNGTGATVAEFAIVALDGNNVARRSARAWAA